VEAVIRAPADGLRVSAVLPTRNRPAHALQCVCSILTNHDLLELVVVDQSDDDTTEKSLRALADERMRYVRSELRGVTNGRNVGIDITTGDIIAWTDDDCRVPSDWISRIAHIFSTDPDAAVVCGRVHVPAEIYAKGFAVGFEPEVRDWRGRFPPPNHDWGLTANLAVRRDVLQQVGRFDPLLGAGAPLRSGGEPDFLFRVLRAGLKVVNAREVEVTHLGVRTSGAETRALISAYGTGISAALVKHVRLGDFDAVLLYVRWIAWFASVISRNAIRGTRPLGARFALSFLSGTRQSFRFGIDRKRRMYLPHREPLSARFRRRW